MIYSDSFTTDLKAYRDEQADILRELSKYYFKLFITIRCKKDRNGFPRFPKTDEFSYQYREDIVRHCLKILAGNLKLGHKQCWWLAIHENSSRTGDAAHVHVALTFHRDMSEEFLITRLERWQKYLSREFGLDVCFRKHGKINGDILVQSQERVKSYMAKLEDFHVDEALGYRPFFKCYFTSKNCWDKCPRARDANKISSKAIEKPITPRVIEPVEEKTLETKEPFVSKKNQSGFLNFKTAIMILGVVGVLGYLLKRKSSP
jgi:hypothetical protein